MSETGYTSVSHEGFSVETNTGDEAAIRLSMGVEETPAPEKVEAPADGTPAADAKPVEEQKADAPDATDRNPDGTFKARDSVQSRIDKAIAKQREAERIAKAAEDRAIAAERRAQESEAARTARTAPEPPAREVAKPEAAAKFAFPKYEEWAGKNPDAAYEDYVEEKTYARVKFERQQEDRERTDRAQWDEHRKLVQAHEARVSQARTQYPDYDALVSAGNAALAAAGLVNAAGEVNLPPALGKAILSSERSTDIIRDLASHPSDAIQFAKEAQSLPLEAASMVRRVLESRLAAAPSGPVVSAKPVSAAKPLIKPVSGTPIASDPDDGSDDEPIEAHIRRENARDRKAGRR